MFLLKLTTDQVLLFHWVAGSSQVITLGKKEGLSAKAKFLCKLTPWCVVEFLLLGLA